MPSLITGRLFDLGIFKLPLLAASILIVVATVLIAECTQYWHFLLCQGFAIGVCFPFSFSFPLRAKDSFEAFFVSDLRILAPSWMLFVWPNWWDRRVLFNWLLCTEDKSIEGACTHSNPPLISRYCTCILSRTRRISALITDGGFEDVVATLHKLSVKKFY